MRIEIDPSVANDPSAFRWLDRIMRKVEDGWHIWDTTDESDMDAIANTTWIRDNGRQGDSLRDLLVASTIRTAWPLDPHQRRIRVTNTPTLQDHLKPKDATLLAEQPLTILVENRFSDGAFVRRLIKELASDIHRLWAQFGEPIRLDSLGGIGQIQKEVKRRCQNLPFRPRLVVIADSDRKHPNASANRSACKLYRRCRQENLFCWVLAKRTSENYIPLILLRKWRHTHSDHRRLIEAWDGLSDEQKDFLDMKHGLPDKPSPPEEELFSGLSDTSHDILSRGFGKTVYKCWELDHAPVKTELLARGHSDVQYGIDSIRKEL